MSLQLVTSTTLRVDVPKNYHCHIGYETRPPGGPNGVAKVAIQEYDLANKRWVYRSVNS